MALSQAAAVVIDHQAAVVPRRILESQGAIEQDLARGGLEQIGAAHHFGDAHGGIVDRAGKLVAGASVAPPDYEVAKIHAGHKTLRAQVAVDKLDHFAVAHAEAPVDAFGRVNIHRRGAGQLRQMSRQVAARAGVHGFVVEDVELAAGARGLHALMRRGQRGIDVLARTTACEQAAAMQQLAPRCKVKGAALALHIGRVGTTLVRTLLPADA